MASRSWRGNDRKKIGAKHKPQLSDVTGSKRFLHTGLCRVGKRQIPFRDGEAGRRPGQKASGRHQNIIPARSCRFWWVMNRRDAEEEGEAVAVAAPKLPSADLAMRRTSGTAHGDILQKEHQRA